MKTALLAAGLGLVHPTPYIVRDSGVLMPAPRKLVPIVASFPLIMRPPVLGAAVTYNTDFNWSLNALPGAVTHGGGSNGNTWNSSGFLAAASAGRLTFDPLTLTCLGIWLEPSMTNAAPDSQNLGGWVTSFTTVTNNTTTSPDNTADADTLTGDSSSPQSHDIFQNSISANTYPNCFSMFAKSGSVNFCFMVMPTTSAGAGDYIASAFQITSGSPATGSTALGTGAGSRSILATGTRAYAPTGWSRPWLSGTLAHTDTHLQFGPNDATTLGVDTSGFGDFQNNPNTSIITWQYQLENNGFPTTPIIVPSTTAVTRTADTATTTNATYIAQRAFRISGRTPEGPPPAGVTQIIWQVDDGTTSNTATVYRASNRNLHLKVVTSGTTVCDLDSGVTVADYTSFVCAIRLAAANFGISVNGSAAVTFTTSGSVPAITTGRFGTDTAGANYWFGTLARVQGATTMTNAQLQSQST